MHTKEVEHSKSVLGHMVIINLEELGPPWQSLVTFNEKKQTTHVELNLYVHFSGVLLTCAVLHNGNGVHPQTGRM